MAFVDLWGLFFLSLTSRIPHNLIEDSKTMTAYLTSYAPHDLSNTVGMFAPRILLARLDMTSSLMVVVMGSNKQTKTTR